MSYLVGIHIFMITVRNERIRQWGPVYEHELEPRQREPQQPIFLWFPLQVYKMNFDNAAFKHRMPQQKTAPGYEKLPMKRGIFFDMFPFSVIFRRDMTMYRIGDGLKEVFSDLQGKKVNEEFTLVRPMLEFSWDNVSPDVWSMRSPDYLTDWLTNWFAD